MAKLNLYKISKEKKDEFYKTLAEQMRFIEEKEFNEREKSVTLIKFYLFNSSAKNLVEWEWVLKEFGQKSIYSSPNSKGILVIQKDEVIYAASFGSSHFLIDKYADREFPFNYAKRTSYKNITTTALNSPNSTRNKTISSFAKCKELMYESGDSFSKIKAKMDISKEDERINGTIEIGNSIRFSMKTNTLENVLEIVKLIEDTLQKEPTQKIPLFQEIRQDKVQKLDEKLLDTINDGNISINISEFDIVGTDEVFYQNNFQYSLIYNRKSFSIEELDFSQIRNFIEENEIPSNEVLKIKVRLQNDNEAPITKSLKEILDFTCSDENAILIGGKWYEYNEDFLEFLRNDLESINIIYEPQYDNFVQEYETYIQKLYDDNNHEMSKKELKNNNYKEKMFNSFRGKEGIFKTYDREYDYIGDNKIEVMDLYGEKTIYAVKIGKASSKLCYAVDQSLSALQFIKENKRYKSLEIKKIGIWIILERKKKLKKKNGKIVLDDLKMLSLKSRIAEWKKRVRLEGYEPVIRINYT